MVINKSKWKCGGPLMENDIGWDLTRKNVTSKIDTIITIIVLLSIWFSFKLFFVEFYMAVDAKYVYILRIPSGLNSKMF